MIFSLPEHINPQHSLVTKRYAVYTPPVHQMIQQIGDWIDQQRPGGYIYGASRLGKSKGIQWHLTEVLEERFKTVLPLIVWCRRPDSQASEADFWNQLLVASNFEFARPGKPPKKSEAIDLCINRFIAIAQSAERNYVVLMIDEAQDLSFREWKWLVGLQNQLDYKGYLLSVFSVGTHQLGYQHEYLASTGNAHVAGRFMAAHTRFHGLRSLEELRYVLNGYDIDSEWPGGSGISFLEYFSSSDFKAGKRLADHSAIFWNALLELAPKVAQKNLEFPMQHIASAVEVALFRLANGDDWDLVTSFESWLDSLSRSNFSDHMRIILNPG